MVELGGRGSLGRCDLALDRIEHFANPFSHWVADGLICDEWLAAVNAEWPPVSDPRWTRESGKWQRKWSMPIEPPIAASQVLAALNSPETCALIASLIGEHEVIPDPGQFGAGLHAIPRGGFLGMHTDFQFHRAGIRRVANLLLYVNQDWRDEWGGALCLGRDRSVQYLPIGGRAVIFRTDLDSFHGHPEPLTCPEGVMRRSIAAYYYTREQGEPDTTRYLK